MSWPMTVISEATASMDRLQHHQISSTTPRHAPLRTPDHYEVIDQIGKGKCISTVVHKIRSEMCYLLPISWSVEKISKKL